MINAIKRIANPRKRKKQGILRTLLASREALIGGSIVLFFVLVALFAPQIAPGKPDAFAGAPTLPPSSDFLLGTTHLGKDVFKQTVWGARNSLIVGFGTSALALFIAIVVGMSAGYFRGRVDEVLSLIMNLFLVIPGLPLLIILSGYLRPGTATVIFVLSLTGWAFAARIVRSQTLMLRERDFVAAAKSRDTTTRLPIPSTLPPDRNTVPRKLANFA